MTPDLRYEFRVDRANNKLDITRDFAAKRQLVWDCHTRSELLDRWFAPEGLTTKTSFMNFREGGYWHYAMVAPDGQEYWSRLDYKTIDPIDGYTALDGFCDASGALLPDMPRADWGVTFTDGGERTTVRTIVAYASEKDLETVIGMGMEEGMTSTLERLDTLLLTLNEPRAVQ